MAADDAFYRAAERRIEWLTLVLGAAAAAAAAIAWGGRVAAGVGAGALLAWVNYRWLKQGIDALAKLAVAQADTPRVRIPKKVYLKFLGRYALILAVVYVIFARSLLPGVAVLAGLFALAAAVVAEMLYELLRSTQQPNEL